MKDLEFLDIRILDNACEQTLKYYSPKSQMVALLEEISELGVLLAKKVNDKDTKIDDFEFRLGDEMADVYFLMR